MKVYDTSLDYDYEDTPKFMGEQEIERELDLELIERRAKNDVVTATYVPVKLPGTTTMYPGYTIEVVS